jgi:hypothetical protein
MVQLSCYEYFGSGSATELFLRVIQSVFPQHISFFIYFNGTMVCVTRILCLGTHLLLPCALVLFVTFANGMHLFV